MTLLRWQELHLPLQVGLQYITRDEQLVKIGGNYGDDHVWFDCEGARWVVGKHTGTSHISPVGKDIVADAGFLDVDGYEVNERQLP